MEKVDHIAAVTDALHALDIVPLATFVKRCDGMLWICGNGGSHAIAQHWACDLTKAATFGAQSLGSNAALTTAWANDDGYDRIFAAELERFGVASDRLICLSCSGRSPNILGALDAARRLEIPALLITGQSAPTYGATPTIRIPSRDYGVIEDCFAVMGHWLTKELAR